MFNPQVVSNSLWLHELWHAQLLCPSLSPWVSKTHVHWVTDAIQPYHPLLLPSSLVLNLFQHQSLFQWVSCLYHAAKVLELQLQHQPFQWIFRVDFLKEKVNWFDLLAVQRTLKNLLQHHSLKSINYSMLSLLYVLTLTSIHDYCKHHSFDYADLCQQCDVFAL